MTNGSRSQATEKNMKGSKERKGVTVLVRGVADYLCADCAWRLAT